LSRKVREMPVEKLTVIEGPMAGFDENSGPIESAGSWMRSHGISPGFVMLGGLAGAVFAGSGEGMIRGGAKWALLFGLGNWIYSRCGR
jgi:hypothetical protein